MKRLLGNLIIALFLVFSFSCSEDDKAKEEEITGHVFTLRNQKVSYSLEGSNLFLLQEDVAGDFVYRNYVISDGEYIEGEGGDLLEDYTNATFLIYFQLSTSESFSPADYIQHASWISESEGYYGYLFTKSGSGNSEISFYTGTGDRSPMKISGGFEDGETMRMEFRGEVMYSRFNPSNGGFMGTAEDVVLLFEGTVDDRR